MATAHARTNKHCNVSFVFPVSREKQACESSSWRCRELSPSGRNWCRVELTPLTPQGTTPPSLVSGPRKDLHGSSTVTQLVWWVLGLSSKSAQTHSTRVATTRSAMPRHGCTSLSGGVVVSTLAPLLRPVLLCEEPLIVCSGSIQLFAVTIHCLLPFNCL